MKSATQLAVAADYMQRDVITVAPDDTLRQALALMTENHITGLPVMDEKARCVGLITSSDILNYEQEHSSNSDDEATADLFDPETQQWESVQLTAFGLEEFGDVRVSDVMSRNLVWVERNTPLVTVAQTLIDQRVHRVLVLDEKHRLYGILSAYDMVRVVAEG